MLKSLTLLLFLVCLIHTSVSAQTDITNSAGTITAQYSDSPAGEGIANVIDNQSSTKYLTFNASAWIQFQATSSYVVTRYSITSANDAPERDPLNWTFQGSNNGTSWTTLNTQSNQDFPNRLQRREFTFTNSTAYSYYRLQMTNNSGTILQLAEWEIFGTTTGGTNVVTVFQHTSYGGTSGAFAVGTYTLAQMQAKGVANEWISSVQVSAGYQVTFYENDNFGGATLVKTANDATLVDDGWNDRTSSMAVAAVTGTAPAAPSNLSASAVSGSQINLSWTDNSNNETLFRIERSTNGGTTFTSLTTVGANVTTYSNTGLSANTTYHYRVRAENANGNSGYSNTANATTQNTGCGTFPASWQEHWFEHAQNVTRVSNDCDVGIYYDNNMDPSVTWLHQYVGNAWRYSKNLYGDMSGGTGDGRLFAIFHYNRYGGGHPGYWYDAAHDNRNVIDVGQNGSWAQPTGWSLDATIHEIGHIVESTTNNTKGSPAFPIWGDSKWCVIYQYDIYVSLNWTSEATRWFNEQQNDPWFRDWFYPIWRDRGRGQALNRFFQYLAQYFPKDANRRYTRNMNFGEFVHFWSGAAGVNLKSQATTAFGWDATKESQFNQARIDFPFTYGASAREAATTAKPNPVLKNIKDLSVSVWPNPLSTRVLNIDIDDADESMNGRVEIYSQQGAKVYEGSIGKKGITHDLSNQPKGYYIALIHYGDKVVKRKIKLE